ncbi:MAG: hypothetical protein A2Z34_01660 [Planctomycetes bacterium RBG_16_59_8]|nr:MAG: hypothetical protein A2Z34_01660 [Planctomycetes bacterium RBG_16_59_8]
MTITYGVIVHGGAWNIPDEAVDDHRRGVAAALGKAHALLAAGGAALDAVEIAVALMEDDPTFDAGRGAFVNSAGEVELDAIIAVSDRRLGAVCAVQNIRNPIRLARRVMEKTPHVMLAGKGANLFAREEGIAECRPEDLLVGRELERYHAIRNMSSFEPKDAFRKPQGMGTVGCVSLDKSGRIAIGVSTGGTPHKRSGRVGDTPIFGCGGYVEEMGGAAATGFGEDIIRILMTRQAIDYLKQGHDPMKAASQAVDDLGKVGGLGGVILLCRQGYGLAFNTPRMAFALRIEDSPAVVGIEPKDC